MVAKRRKEGIIAGRLRKKINEKEKKKTAIQPFLQKGVAGNTPGKGKKGLKTQNKRLSGWGPSFWGFKKRNQTVRTGRGPMRQKKGQRSCGKKGKRNNKKGFCGGQKGKLLGGEYADRGSRSCPKKGEGGTVKSV